MSRRVLLLITDLEIGGTPTVVRELALRLRSPEVHVEVACLADWGPVADELDAAGVPVTSFGARRAADFPAVVWHLVQLIRRGNFDTIFSFLVHANAVAAAASLFVGGDVRFFQSIQTTQPNPRWHWRLQGVIESAAERIVVPSPSVARAAQDWSSIDPEKIVVIPNAIDPAQFPQSPIPAVKPRPYPIGFIGRLDPIKRVPDLLQAIAKLDDEVVLHVFGEGPERATIESEIARLHLRDRVTLHGAIARPQEALKQIGLLVLPSAAEGFGLVLIEAMAAGVPVVATDVAGIRDLVRQEENGILVPVGSSIPLAEAIRRIIKDGALRNRLIAGACEGVRSRYTWDVVLARYLTLLNPL